MIYQERDLSRLSRSILVEMAEEFERVGIFFRIFDRVKSPASVVSKKKMKGEGYYDGKNKLIRDVIGIRIVLYFPDDIAIVHSRLKKMYSSIEETIDQTNETNFEPVRINIIFKLRDGDLQEFRSIVNDSDLDATFEVQLRTILSEGWHEVDHDLRYKCREYWNGSSDLSRSFNGILATLETSEYATLRVFDQLCFRHFKTKNIPAMIQTKFRLRFPNYQISPQLSSLVEEHILKDLYKIDRERVIQFLFNCGVIIPMTLETLIFLINYKFFQNPFITNVMPDIIIKELEAVNEITDVTS